MLKFKLRYCREELEMTQKELGRILGVSRKTICGWETEKDYIPLKKLVKLCNTYHYNIDFILSLNCEDIRNDNEIILDTIKIGINLKNIRKNRQLTQSKVANILGITQSCYSQYENGKSLLTTLSLYLFANYFKVSIYEILN